jgi:hypothetical protein
VAILIVHFFAPGIELYEADDARRTFCSFDNGTLIVWIDFYNSICLLDHQGLEFNDWRSKIWSDILCRINVSSDSSIFIDSNQIFNNYIKVVQPANLQHEL